jgi:SAM-dependent methyltransferase
MRPEYHSTRDYHINGLRHLGWELTVCNALFREDTSCRRVLRRDASYGKLLYAFLDRLMPMEQVRRVLEVGGGYGHLMRDFLALRPDIEAVMLDLSPVLLEEQRRNLAGFRVEYVQSDFFDVDASFLRRFDLAVFNENLGDFPVMLNLDGSLFEAPKEVGGTSRRILDFFIRYGFDRPTHEPFHCNLGAMEAVEMLCLAGVPYIFLSEHSCEAKVPEPHASYVRIHSAGNPERIALYGHDEYTVAFTPLAKIATRLGYDALRGLWPISSRSISASA